MKEETTQSEGLFNRATQVLLPALTATGFLLTSLKRPEWGLVINLVSQIFWFYASWKAWKQAGQIGILLTTILMTIIIAAGVVNYWFL